ncbi:SDR family oxidoreductase [Candidatus Pelagibacter ubique]|jgi:nucleoside-diphosphate-sugar epimerase|nr:SDR family oxidoreductase [Candidatus Pelagibacter ubique]
MKKILITGGAGYIGNILTRDLLKDQDNIVTVLDSFAYSQQSSFFDIITMSNLNVINHDVRDMYVLKEQIIKNDVVIPLAGVVGAPACEKNKLLATELNLDQLINIKKIISKNQSLIVPITNSGYGIGEKDKYCDEQSPLNPISHYGKTKVEAEKHISDLENFISLRLATVFGVSARMRVDLLVNDFTLKAVRDKYVVLFEEHFKRNFIHVKDVSSAFIFCMNNFEKMKSNIYNVGLEDANLSKLELCKIIESKIDLKIISSKIGSDPDKRDYIVSNKKIYSTGWSPKIKLETGIEELIKFYSFIKFSNFSNI